MMVVRFTGAESTFAYFEATREYLLSICARCVCALLSDKLKILQLWCTRCQSKSDRAIPRRHRVPGH